jgi:hypothetical protein
MALFFYKTEKRLLSRPKYFWTVFFTLILCRSLIQYNKDCLLALHYVKAFSVNDSFRSVWQLCTVLYLYSQLYIYYFSFRFYFHFLLLCSDPDPDWIRVQKRQKEPSKMKKVKFHVLKCWMFSLGGLKASPVA